MRASRLALACAALIALVAAAWLLAGPRREDRPSIALEAPAAPPASERGGAPVERTEPAPSGARETLAAVEDDPVAEERGPSTHAAPASRRVRGSVLGLAGEPLGGVPLALEQAPDVELGRSRPDGAFELELRGPLAGGWKGSCLVVPDARFALVRTSCVREEERPLLVVLAPALDLGGRVVDDQGAPLEEVDLRIESGPMLFSGFTQVLDQTSDVESWSTTTDASGRFSLARCPGSAAFVLAAYAPGFLPRRTPLPQSPRSDLEIVLARDPQAGDCTVAGRVLRADGGPAAGASVRLGEQRTRAREDGTFRLACGTPFDETPLAAWLPGVQPAVLERFGERLRSAPDGLPPVELVLGPPALELAGRLLDARGEPLVGWEVSLASGTELSAFRVPPQFVESEVSGIEPPVLSDSRGAFRLGGLRARSYVVRAWARDKLLSLRSPPVEAGRDDLVLTLPEDALRARVTGQVVSRSGLPLPGALVNVQMVLHETAHGSSTLGGSAVRTDDAGRFELVDVPRSDLVLSVGGEDVIPERFAIAPHEPDEGHRLSVAARCHFTVEPLEPGVWTSFSMEDARQELLPIYTFQGGGWGSTTHQGLAQGPSRPYAVSEDAVAIVLRRAEGEPKRVEIRLVPGDVALLRP